jgi:hypothetical protein
MKASACYTGLFSDGRPNLCAELIRVREAVAIAGEAESAASFAGLQIAHIITMLSVAAFSVAAMRRNDFRDFGGQHATPFVRAICTTAFRDCAAHLRLLAIPLDIIGPKRESLVSSQRVNTPVQASA